MAGQNDEYASRAFENLSSILSGENTDMDALDVIGAYFGIKEPVNYDGDKSDYLDSKYDIKSRTIRLGKNWYKNSVMPMTVMTEEGLKAVIPDSLGRCRYYAEGKYIKITAKNAGMFANSGLCYYKGLGEGRITTKQLLKYMFDSISIKDKLNVLALSVLVTFMGMVFPFANYMIFNYIIPSGTISDILPVAALFVGVIGTTAAALILQSIFLTNVISKVGVYIQGALFSRIMRLKVGIFKERNAGETAEIILNFSDIGSIVSAQSITAAIGMVLSLAYLIQMNIYAPSLMGVVIVTTLVIIALAVREARLFVRWKSEYEGCTAELSGFVYEFFSLMEKIKLNGAATRMFERWTERYKESAKKRDKPLQLKYSQAISKAVELGALIVVFYIGAHSSLPMSNYIAFNSAYGSFVAAISSIGIVLESAAALSSSIKLLKPILDGETEETADKKQIKEIKGEIEFSNVSFRYNADSPNVIDGLNLKIHTGESIGIVGMSGCGKSTLLRLLLGFEEPTGGGIFIDGTDIREMDKGSYRKKLGIVLQDSKLLNDDIYSNITLTAPNATTEDVWEAVENSGLTEDIDNMPMGLRTIVSEENSTISGGQKQRILIARSIVAKPSILIFDEATSALDNITQSKVISSVGKLKSTRIMIAHRLSTIENCDRILVLDKGKIAESGTFRELAVKEGIFKKLLERQTI